MNQPEAAQDAARRRRWAIRNTTIATLTIIATSAIAYLGWFSPQAMADPEDGNSLILRWTGRVATVLFLLAFTASSLAREKLRIGRILVRARRTIGLSMAGAMAVHLVAIWHILYTYGHQLDAVVLTLGFAGYGFIFAMALTSNDFMQRTMGIWWGRMHRTGMIYLWLIAMTIYLLKTLSDPGAIVILFLLALVGSGYLRARNMLSRTLSKRRTKTG